MWTPTSRCRNVTPNRVYANIDSVMQRPKGIKRAPELEDYIRVCDREEQAVEEHDDELSDLPF